MAKLGWKILFRNLLFYSVTVAVKGNCEYAKPRRVSTSGYVPELGKVDEAKAFVFL